MELSYFYMNYLPALWSVYNGSQSTLVRDNLPNISDKDILDGVTDLLLKSVWGAGWSSMFNTGLTSNVLRDSIRVQNEPSAIEKVGLFLKMQGVMTKMTYEDVSEKFKNWYADTFHKNAVQSVQDSISQADPTSQNVSVTFDVNTIKALKKVAELTANNALRWVYRSGGGSTGTISWDSVESLQNQCCAFLSAEGLITAGTKLYLQNFPQALTRDGSRVNIFKIVNKKNGRVIPAMKWIYPSIVGNPIEFDSVQLSISNLDTLTPIFDIRGFVSGESVGKTGNDGSLRRQSVLGYSDMNLSREPFSTETYTSGSTTYTIELFNSMTTSTHVYSNTEESVWSNPVPKELYSTNNFFYGMTDEEVMDVSNYELVTLVRNNVKYNSVVEHEVIYDPAVVTSLINETFDIVTAGYEQFAGTVQGRTLVLNPSTVGTLTGSDVLSGDLVDALPASVNAYPVDSSTTIGSVAIPISQAITNVDTYAEQIGASEGITVNPLVSDTGDYGMFTLYKMTTAELKALSNKLWSSDFVDNFHPFKNDPSEALISLMAYPIDIDASSISSVIVCGNLSCSPATGKIVNKLFQTKSLGYINIPEKFNNYLDYSPYTKVSAYLPFIGMVTLDPDEVIGSLLFLDYRVELLTGTCVATLRVKKGNMDAILYQFNGNMGVTLPLSASDFGRVYSNLIGGALAMGVGAMTGGVGGVALTTALQATNTAMNAKPNISKAGGMGGNSGMCGNMSAYVILDYVVPDVPDGYKTFKGKPTNKYLRVGSLNGFISLDSYYLDIPNLNEAEREELDGILKDGFII